MAKTGVPRSSPQAFAELPRPASETNRRAPRTVLDTMLRVTTPENISFQYQLAGPFRRVLAYFLDILVSVVGYIACAIGIYLLITFAVLPLATVLGGGSLVEAIMGVLTGFILIGFFIVFWFYGAVMETYCNGQTWGKRWTQLRVLSADGHSIDGVQATLRNFFRWLDIAPIVAFATIFQTEGQIGGSLPTCLFGLIMMTLSTKYQRVGDLVAGTVVISETSKPQPHLAVFTDDRVQGLAELIPNSFVVPPSMAKAIADYVDQRRFLPFQRASEIAGHLARPLIEKFGLLPDTDHDLFICALYYKTFSSWQNDEPSQLTPGGLPPRGSSPNGPSPSEPSAGSAGLGREPATIVTASVAVEDSP